MPTWEHEFPLDLIRNAPDLAAKLFGRASGKPLPSYTRARCDASEATTTAPAELLSDSVVVLENDASGPNAPPLAAIMVESQRQPDDNKPYSWPAYVANVRHRLRCPVHLLVLTPTQSLAYRCAEPIDLGCGELRPVALPMTRLEPATDPDHARREPELAILAVAMRPTENPAAIRALPPALDVIDKSKRALYADYVYAALPAAARTLLEDILTASTYEWKSDLAREYAAAGKAEGKAEGEAKAILTMLEARGFTITDSIRQRVTQCTDIDQLDTWVRRAATAEHPEDLFS